MGLSLMVMLSVAAMLSGQQLDLSAWVQATQIALARTPADTPAVQFTLENRSGKDVTAWGVNILCTRPDGTKSKRSYMAETFAGYENLPQSETSSKKLLRAHDAITPMVTLEPSGCNDVSVSVSFLVFADRTSVGDARAVNEVFEKRERISKALTDIVTALRAGQMAGGNREGLSVALQYLNSPNQQDYEHWDKRIMRRQLHAALRQAPGGMPIDQALIVLLDRAERALEAVNKHKR